MPIWLRPWRFASSTRLSLAWWSGSRRPYPSGGATHAIMAPYNSALMFDAQGHRDFSLRQNPSRSVRRVRTVSADSSRGEQRLQRSRWLSQRHQILRRPASRTATPSACSSATRRFIPARFAASPPTARSSSSIFPTTAGLATPPPPSSICAWRASAPSKIAAGSLRVTNSGITVSIDPYGRIFRPMPPDVRAAADLPYDFRTDKTLYTRFGDWFAWLCVLVSAILLGLTFRKAV